MDFRELTYIIAVADEHSVTAASKKLYISQPSLSYIISKVEEELGVKLFDRNTTPISLTYAGEKYVQSAREILRIRDNMRREINDIGHGTKGRINIGIPNDRAGYMLPVILPVFRKQFPGIEIRLQESKSDEILRNLMADKIGFCILPGAEDDVPPGAVAEHLYREKLYLVAGEDAIPPEMILSGADTEELPLVDLKQVCRLMPFIMQKHGQYIRKKTDSVFRKFAFFPRDIIEVSASTTATELANLGLGLAIVPERAINALGGRDRFHCYRYQEEQDSWEVCAVYKKGIYLDKAERAFIEITRELFSNTR